MRIFLAAAGPALADQVQVGLAAFPDIQVEQATGMLALEKIRRTQIDGLVLVLDPAVPENEELLEKVRIDAPGLDIVVIGHEALLAKLREEKVRGRIFAVLKQPLEPVEFFRAINRLRQKRATARAR